jgi:hypothetical protein
VPAALVSANSPPPGGPDRRSEPSAELLLSQAEIDAAAVGLEFKAMRSTFVTMLDEAASTRRSARG